MTNMFATNASVRLAGMADYNRRERPAKPALTRAGIVTQSDTTPMVGAIVHPATEGGAEEKTQGRAR